MHLIIIKVRKNWILQKHYQNITPKKAFIIFQFLNQVMKALIPLIIMEIHL